MYAKLNPVKLGLAGGLLWGVSFALLTLICIHTGYAKILLEPFVQLYPGYTISYLGALIGLVEGFFDAGIGFFLLAWLYNKFNP